MTKEFIDQLTSRKEIIEAELKALNTLLDMHQGERRDKNRGGAASSW